MKKDNIKVCSKCGVKPVEKVNSSYCNDCYREYLKDYRESHKGYFLYVVMSKDNEVLYVGSTTRIWQRVSAHVNGFSNIKQLMETNKWSSIKYIDVTNKLDLRNRGELDYLENSLIQLYEPKWNKKLNIIKDMDKLREFELISKLHSFEVNKNFKTFITREEFLRKQKKLSKLGA